MTNYEQTAGNGAFEALKRQRNMALDAFAVAEGQIAALRAEISDLKKSAEEKDTRIADLAFMASRGANGRRRGAK